MGARGAVVAVSLAITVALVAGFWAGRAVPPADRLLAGQTTSTTPPDAVEVLGKVLEQSPTKDAVDLESMAETGVDALSWKAGFGAALIGAGVLLVGVVSRPLPARHRRR